MTRQFGYRLAFLISLSVFSVGFSFAQLIPRSAHVNLYFPHVANGGEPAAQWQMRFVFDNPHPTAEAFVALAFFGDSGAPLAVNLGSGSLSVHAFSIPPNGSRVFRSVVSSGQTVTGWAFAAASIPVQGVAAFRLIGNGTPKFEINAEPTPVSHSFRFPVTAFTGLAVSNIYGQSMSVQGQLVTGGGQVRGQTSIVVPAGGHTSFVVSERFPGLEPDFEGVLALNVSSVAIPNFIAWAVRGDSSGVLSTLPSGGFKWPGNQWDNIWLAYLTVLQAAIEFEAGLGQGPVFSGSPIELRIDPNLEINAFAANGNVVQVNLALAELISDSPSELAFAIAHELGHIYQQRTGIRLWSTTNAENDADVWGVMLSLLAGYDPYASAGALSKLAMVTGTSSLAVQQFIDNLPIANAHESYSTRITEAFGFIEFACSASVELAQFCNLYKSLVHPHFPVSAPLLTIPDAPRVVLPDPTSPARK
jgi:hypothetical protein